MSREETERQPEHPTAERLDHLKQSFEAAIKPRLRGWLHFGAGPLAFVLGLGLLVVTPELNLRLAVAVYVATTVLLFGSARRITWVPVGLEPTPSSIGWITPTSTCLSRAATPPMLRR